MTITKPENPDYTWDIKIDRSLQHPVKVVAARKNVEIRELISDVLREAISEKMVGE